MNDLRIAWLFPSLQGGNYWQPVLSEFNQFFDQMAVYTGSWSGYSPGFENTLNVQVVGKTKFIETRTTEGYAHGISYVSPKIIFHLGKFNPNIIFSSGFSIWTLFIILLKFIYKWRIVIVYEGSSPNVDYSGSPLRIWLRRWMTRSADACITNTHTGKAYLINILHTRESCVFQQPYEVPDPTALLKLSSDTDSISRSQRPIFLFIGQLIERKGLHLLLQACVFLESWGYQNSYTLQVIGQGALQEDLKTFSQHHNLPVDWIGWLDYGKIGTYFLNADIFVLPTLEDTWGMVVLEAMVFGKPVLCSQWAGASEVVVHGESGYVFDPKEPEDIAKLMRYFIDHPDAIEKMGEKSKQVIAPYTPKAAAEFLKKIVSFVEKI